MELWLFLFIILAVSLLYKGYGRKKEFELKEKELELEHRKVDLEMKKFGSVSG